MTLPDFLRVFFFFLFFFGIGDILTWGFIDLALEIFSLVHWSLGLELKFNLMKRIVSRR